MLKTLFLDLFVLDFAFLDLAQYILLIICFEYALTINLPVQYVLQLFAKEEHIGYKPDLPFTCTCILPHPAHVTMYNKLK